MMVPDEILPTTMTVDRDVVTNGFDRLAAESIAQLDDTDKVFAPCRSPLLKYLAESV